MDETVRPYRAFFTDSHAAVYNVIGGSQSHVGSGVPPWFRHGTITDQDGPPKLLCTRLEAIASRLKAIACRLAIASRLEAIASRLEAIACRLAIPSRLEAIAIRFHTRWSVLEPASFMEKRSGQSPRTSESKYCSSSSWLSALVPPST